MVHRSMRIVAASVLSLALAGCGTVGSSLGAPHHPAPLAAGPSQWTAFDYNQQHNAVFNTPNKLLNKGVSWQFREFEGLPSLSSPPIDESVLGPTGAAIATNHQFGDPVGASVVDGVVYADTNTHYVYALNALNGHVLWDNTTVNANMSNPLIADGEVLIGIGDAGFQYGQLPVYKAGKPVIRGYSFSGVEAFSQKTGKPLWTFPTLGEVMPTPVVYHNAIYFATGGGHVYALNVKTGQELWKTTINSFNNMDSLNWWTNPQNGQTEILTGGTDPGYLYAISANTGKILWQFAPNNLSANGLGEATPAVSPRLGLVFDEGVVNRTATQEEQSIFALNAATGQLVWQDILGPGKPTPPFKGSAALMEHDGIVYNLSPVTHDELAIDAKTGKILWQTPLPKVSHGAGTYVDGYLIVPNGPYLSVLDAHTGQLLRNVKIGGSFGVVDPVVVGGTVFVTNGWGYVIAVPLSHLIP
ncbi:MAG: hypothetical protein C7B47_12395 [Sulfobacillus thermosulfidooxidans]|uniref:Pyrrolo-quinoline quinone repeat domain-containing protein n=1 Tax=Sulfobacillus thermosulfidooxidans TaxID=28034 RepID=A0A2T2WT53_SULTH|nr:MAG: hypothetical protein C7B47_12395 [Sulfobacillus thermosulfidooxidans]